MTTYAVLLPDHEDQWAVATDDEKAAMYGQHEQFAKLLAERGHQVVGGAELTASATARTLRTAADGSHTVTDGPYAEATEQLSGFYLVTSEDPDDLLEVCQVLARPGSAIEVRATVDHGGEA